LKVFFDHNLLPHLAHALNILLGPEGDEVIHLTDRFPANAEDVVWMTALGDEGGWVVISADRRINRNRLEREAWRRSGLVVFFLTSQWQRLRKWKSPGASCDGGLTFAIRLASWRRPRRSSCRSPTAPADFGYFGDRLPDGITAIHAGDQNGIQMYEKLTGKKR